jgi:hypothetical protein
MLDYLRLLLDLILATARTRRALVAENVLLRQQLMVLTRPSRRRFRLRRYDRLFWVLAHRLVDGWRRHLVLVRPETVVAWHRRGWRLLWWWRSRCPLGRPRLSAEVRELIATMARENPAWGAERIRGELLKLGIAVSRRSVQRYRRSGPARPPRQSWRTFLANHRPRLWAADLLTVQTLAFRTLYVLFFVAHDRRELVHLNVTAHPTAAWVWRQLIEATPCGAVTALPGAGPGRQLRARLRRASAGAGHRDGAHPHPGAARERGRRTARRDVGTLCREWLDHLIIVNEAHLRAVLTEFAGYYNRERPHRALDLQTPEPSDRPRAGPIHAKPVLGGLRHTYERAA